MSERIAGSFAFLLALISVVTIANAAAPPSFLPPDATTKVPCVAALGDIYYNPRKLPFGPTFGANRGKPVFQEIMISRRDFERGRNWNDVALRIKGFAVNHIDIWYVPHGHEGFPFPHYDILLVYMPHAQQMHICNPSGRLPSFVLQTILK